MRVRIHSGKLYRALLAAGCLICCAGLLVSAAGHPDNPLGDAVGTIDGDAIAVSGPMSVEGVHGQIKTMLRSGSYVRVDSGSAQINLVEGGKISICGPAHLSLLKSGGALTIALDTGTVRVHIEGSLPVTIYTPLILAKPISIGDGPEDLLVGFDSIEVMCLRANRGAIRVEQQLTGQTIVIPQSGDITITNGQLDTLRSSTGHCVCEAQVSNFAPKAELSQIATAEEVRKSNSDARPTLPSNTTEKPAPKEEPIYQVYVPPLIYDAKAKVQPDIDPKLIVLVRRVRVRPTLIFQGRVEGDALPAPAPTPAPTVAATTAPDPAKTASKPEGDSMMDRARRLWRKIWPPTS